MLLLTLTIVSVIIVYLSGSNLLLGIDSLSDEMPSSYSMFAIMIESTNGEYIEYSEDSWPLDMVINFELTKCVDINNRELDGVFFYANGYATVTSTDTVYCTLYFDVNIENLTIAYDLYGDLDSIIDNDGLETIYDIWDSTLDGDGYRYYSVISQSTTTTTGTVSGISACCYSNGYITTSGSCSTMCVATYVNPTTGATSTSMTSGSCYVHEYCVSDTKCYVGGTTVTGSSCTVGGGTYTTTTDTYDATNPDNYICFGTSSTSECLSDTGTYLYRIIGIFQDSSGSWHLKIIKAEALDTAYVYSTSTSAKWNTSQLYSGLNSTDSSSSYFLYKTSYMSDTWRDYIDTWNFKVLTSNYSYGASTYVICNGDSDCYGGTTYSISGTAYGAMTAEEVWENESDTTTTVSAMIGLMYPADYVFSIGASALTDLSSEYLTAGWLYLLNNDSSAPSDYEWVMANDGGGGYSVSGATTPQSGSWNFYTYIDETFEHETYSSDAFSVRPVFYLTTDVIITSGDGSSTSPYILSTN